MTLVIHSLETVTPEHCVDQAGAAAIAQSICCETQQHRRILTGLYRRAGVSQRYSVLLNDARTTLEATADSPPAVTEDHFVAQSFFPPARTADDLGPTTTERMKVYEERAPHLAVQACRRALQSCPWQPDELTHLITVSCTGFAAPGVDYSIIRDCGLNREIARTHVGFMGCHGAMNAIRVADGYAGADKNARVLLCAVELCTLHQQYGWHPDRIVSNSLFADGAAALTASADGAAALPRLIASGSCVLPQTEDQMSWHIRDHGFEMTLSPEVPDSICRYLKPWLNDWLQRRELSLPEIQSWAVHPGGPKILNACEQALGLEADQLNASRHILSQYGNMSSPTVLFVLQHLVEQQAPMPCIALAFGPGLAVEAGLFA